MQGVRPRSQPSLVDKCRHQDQKNWWCQNDHCADKPYYHITIIVLVMFFPFPNAVLPEKQTY